MSKRYLILPDVQAPYEDRKAVKAFVRFLRDFQPDELVCIGDLVDYPAPSRWSKGQAGEYAGKVKADSEYVKRAILDPIRSVYDGPFKFIEGNHDERPRVYLAKYAPALAEYNGHFEIENLLDFDAFGVERLGDFYDFAPGWTMTHGHLGGIRTTQTPGGSALSAAKNRFQKSIVMGHTHRLGVVYHTYGYGGKVTKTLTGVEVGNLMSMRAATYLKRATANWQQGFCILHVDGPYVRPEIIPILNRKFHVGGITYEV